MAVLRPARFCGATNFGGGLMRLRREEGYYRVKVAVLLWRRVEEMEELARGRIESALLLVGETANEGIAVIDGMQQ